jgi:CheY-like chemotaxis protein
MKSAHTASIRPTTPARSDLSVLVVDDDVDVRTVIAEALEGQGYSVATASDGAAALAILRTRAPRLILLDLTMPVMDGVEFRDAQMDDLDLSAIPTVVITGRPEAGQLGGLFVRGCLGKPLELGELLRLVAHYCA